jgi:predicted dehydrogenase
MPNPIRLAIIGTGLIVTAKHWPALTALPSQFRIVALTSRSPAKAEKLADSILAVTGFHPAVYADYLQMLASEKPEAVSIALPPMLNPEATEAALAAGCHVIAEKPIAARPGDGARMLAWAKACGRVLMIAENYRYKATYRHAAQLIAAGAIGRPAAARWSIYHYIAANNPYHQTAWRLQPEHVGGYLSDAGVHWIAVLRMLLGDIETVSAQVIQVRPDMVPADTFSATLRFASGALGTLAATHAVPGPETALQVAGPDGVLLAWKDRLELWRQDRPPDQWIELSPVDGLVAMYEDFAQTIRAGRQPMATAADALADLRVIVAMLRSSENAGRAIRVADVD